MNHQQSTDHKIKNMLQSVVLIVGMSLVLALSSRLLLGPDIWWGILMGAALGILILPNASPYWLLRLYEARPVQSYQLPQMDMIMSELTRRAQLPRKPELFWIPSHTMNAFAVGSRQHAAIAITQGILQNLTAREMAGVLAHEISHINNNDLRIMTLADLMTRLTHVLALSAMFMLLLTLPLMILGLASVSILGLLLIMAMPSINALLQLGLSRVREFNADLDAARLTLDPEGLASALAKIEYQSTSFWHTIFFPGYRSNQPSVLRSHPGTRERIDRLLSLKGKHSPQQTVLGSTDDNEHGNPYSHVKIHRPRHRFFHGTWH